MSATNSTPIINLPLFIGTDKPAWLTDWNGAMNTIDTAISNLQTAESGTATSLASLAQSVEALSGTVSQHTTAIQTVTTATSGNTASINTINSLIGNGQPTTTDKTIIGAINEIYADIGAGDGVDADEVNYDNTDSGLTATDVQAAIDEINAKIPAGGAVDADDVTYDNTSSGLVATNVQAAIDELATSHASGGWVKLADNVNASSAVTLTIPSGYQLSDFASFVGYNVFSSSPLKTRNSLVVPNDPAAYGQSFVNQSSASDTLGIYMEVSSSAVTVTASGNGAYASNTNVIVYGVLK